MTCFADFPEERLGLSVLALMPQECRRAKLNAGLKESLVRFSEGATGSLQAILAILRPVKTQICLRFKASDEWLVLLTAQGGEPPEGRCQFRQAIFRTA